MYHLIELKGTKIDSAFNQIRCTLDNLKSDVKYQSLLHNRNTTDAYIVTRSFKKTIKGISSKERILPNELCKYCKIKPKDNLTLIRYVQPSINKNYHYNPKTRIVSITGREGLEFPLHNPT